MVKSQANYNGHLPNAKTFQVGEIDYHGREQGFEEMEDCCKRRGLLFRDPKYSVYSIA